MSYKEVRTVTKKTLYLYSFAFITLLIASSFLAGNEHHFVLFTYSLILVVILLNDFINKRNFKELAVEIIAVIIFVLYIIFTKDNLHYSNIIIGLLPLSISLFETFKKLK